MTFKTEFPDFPPYFYPELPEGFEDSSWHNDECPSMLNEKMQLCIFIADEAPLYVVRALDAEGQLTDDELLQTDKWEQVLAFINQKRGTDEKL